MTSLTTTVARLRRPHWLIAFWLLTRVVMLCLFWALFSYIRNDVNYYATSVIDHPWPTLGDIRTVLVEYPTPVVWFLQLVSWFAPSTADGYALVFSVLMAILDALACIALYRFDSPLGAWLWAGAGVLLGPLMWFRFDVVPGLCVLAALYWVHRRPALAGTMIALGAGLKLWPALLIVPMLGVTAPARRRALGFGITGTVLAAVSVASQGLARTLSPLGFQSARGLQIESIWATPLMVSRLWSHDGATHVEFSRYQAYEIFAPGVGSWERAASASGVVVLLLAMILAWLIGFGGSGLPGHRLPVGEDARHEQAVLLACVALVGGVMVTDKTLSPQYLIWLFAPLAITCARLAHGRHGLIALRLAALGAVVIGLTQLVYPLSYAGLISSVNPNPGSTLLLALRNCAFVALAAYSSYQAVKLSALVGVATEPK